MRVALSTTTQPIWLAQGIVAQLGLPVAHRIQEQGNTEVECPRALILAKVATAPEDVPSTMQQLLLRTVMHQVVYRFLREAQRPIAREVVLSPVRTNITIMYFSRTQATSL